MHRHCASSASHNMTCSKSTKLTYPEGVVLLSFSELLLYRLVSTSSPQGKQESNGPQKWNEQRMPQCSHNRSELLC
jgi:hypothetical protein